MDDVRSSIRSTEYLTEHHAHFFLVTYFCKGQRFCEKRNINASFFMSFFHFSNWSSYQETKICQIFGLSSVVHYFKESKSPKIINLLNKLFCLLNKTFFKKAKLFRIKSCNNKLSFLSPWNHPTRPHGVRDVHLASAELCKPCAPRVCNLAT